MTWKYLSWDRVLFLVSKFCSHSAKCSLGSNSSGMYILNSKLPVREELQHWHTCGQPCWPDCTQQAANKEGSTGQGHMRLLFLARLHLASYQSGRSCNTSTHAANPAGQTAQVADQGWATTQAHMWSTLPARPHSKVCIYVVQAHLFECSCRPRYYTLLQLYLERNG